MVVAIILVLLYIGAIIIPGNGFFYQPFIRNIFVKETCFSNRNENNEQFSNRQNETSPLVPRMVKSIMQPEPDEVLSKGIIPIGVDSLKQLEQETANADSKKPIIPLPGMTKSAIKYYEIVEGISPNELIMKFAKTAPKNVQEATKATIVNLLGSLPNYALDAAFVTTNVKLATLLYQMQITGYMFKNAEYRMSLTRNLKGLPKLPPSTTQIQTTDGIKITLPSSLDALSSSSSSVSSANNIQWEGKVTMNTSTGETVSIDIQELTQALSNEVNELRKELLFMKNEREQELKANLLTYIQALPEKELTRLTSDMSQDVIQAIQLFINNVMEKLGLQSTTPEVMIQQNVAQLAQLCMWQMIVGYRLREFEALDKGLSLD
jgi:hypothetical protein